MINLSKNRWLVLALLPCGVLAGLFGFNIVRVVFEAPSQLAYKGELKQLPRVTGARVERGSSPKTVLLIGQGPTPGRAVRSADAVAAALAKASLDQKKNLLRKRIAALQDRQTALSAKYTGLNQQRQNASKGSRQTFTPEMAVRLNEARGRYRTLAANYPTHTDIPVLAQDIKSLEAIQRGSTKVDRSRVGLLSKQMNQARAESSLLASQVRGLQQAEKTVQPDWNVIKVAAQPTWPVGVPGWPIAAGSVLVALILAGFLTKGSREKEKAYRPFIPANKPEVEKIPLELATEESGPLPDDPLTRKAGALYERWLDLVKTLYVPGPAAPQDIYTSAEPLFKETVAYLAEGQDTMTRYLARVVVPGDLFAHVTRTVLMALMGACEAGASAAQQQGMTFAALFHDLAVAPRPANAWDDIGSEVGRLSSGILRKVPGIPAQLLAMIENILVAMDEYPMDTWQNVPRQPELASFAKLLNRIDRFDKVMQKQKTRLTRRIATA